MSFLKSLTKRFTKSAPAPRPVYTPPEPEPEPIHVPEISPTDLIAARSNGSTPLILDCREPWEMRQARIAGSLHIPMNEIPARLPSLDRGTPLVVICAHGNRSLDVAGYLIDHGYDASNLTGGIAAWHSAGGEIESDFKTA